MRELKFRQWVTDPDVDFYKGWESPINAHQDLKGATIINQDDHHIVEQYTGVKDKNGKEIYEGDILEDGRGEKCLVKWTESEAHFGLYTGKQFELTDFVWMRGEDLEVIGNIHENPELLK